MKKLLFTAVFFGLMTGSFAFSENLPPDKPTAPPAPVLTDLPKLSIDMNRVTVSGVSSGGFMAVQLHVAYSTLFKGAASIAGGIWECAKGDVARSQKACMSDPSQIQTQDHIDLAHERAARGEIDDLANLAQSRVMIFASPQDLIIKPLGSDRLEEFYRAVAPTAVITRLKNPLAAHGFPTLSFGNDCDKMGAPWMLNCNDDVAGKILATIEPGHAVLVSRGIQNPNSLVYFDQLKHVKASANMFAWGAAYVPDVCTQGASVRCGVHVALHGCQMNPDFIQRQFIENAGYNEWAETNKLIVLYPQSAKGPDNPFGCWDWFGFTGANYTTKSAAQIEAIRMILSDLGVN